MEQRAGRGVNAFGAATCRAVGRYYTAADGFG
jgi:hypothetical protein